MKKLFLLLLSIVSITEVYSQAVLSGKIIENSTHEALVGASVYVKGTTQGTISDIDGNFHLNTDTNRGTLVFSFVSFQDQEIAFDGDQNFEIMMESAMMGLDEWVVIGYGSVQKDDLSTAVGSLEGIQELKNRPVSTTGLLQGTMAGVNVMNQGGDPGSPANIVIRGLGSPSDQVLWVVDGVPGAPVNAEDIESVSVLKDAASAAIYGSSVGSGGVVVVSTKQAQAGKTKVEANLYTGIQKAYNLPEALNAEEFNAVKNLAADNAGQGRSDAFNANIYPDGAVSRTNWMEEIFRMGKVKRLALSLSGGSEYMKALASIQVDDEQGVLLNTFKKSVKGRVNVDFKLTDKIKFSEWVQAGTSRGYSNDTYSGYTGAIISAIYMPPSAAVYNEDGSYGGVVSASNLAYAGAYGDIVNPVATLKRKDQYNPSYYLRSTSSLEVKITSGLTYKSMFTLGTDQNLNEEFSVKRPEPGKPLNENSKSMSTGFTNKWLSENVITYKKMINNHQLTLMGGYSASYQKTKGFGLTVYGFDSENETARHLVNASDWSKSKPYENMSELSSTSMFSRLSYSFNNRYYFTGSIRNDATSKLYMHNNDGTFMAMSAAWKISSEDFFNVDFIDMLKLRGSWGQIGNVNSVDNYAYVSNLEATRGLC